MFKEKFSQTTSASTSLIRKFLLCVTSLLALAATSEPATTQATGDLPPQAARRLVIISVDGLRPDVLLRAEAPNIRNLMRRGAFTFFAESTDLANTLPTHVSMLTGLQPVKHGITLNDDGNDGNDRALTKPTIFELAKGAGRTTAMVAAKKVFGILDKPGSVDWAIYPTNKLDANGKPIKKFTDEEIGRLTLDVLRQHRPDVLFVHFTGMDTVGHSAGWGTEQQLATMAKIDEEIGKLLAELDGQGARDNTLIILTADHGGAAKGHGGRDSRSRYIPFIMAGPGVRQDYDMTLKKNLVVHVEDTFATGLEWLGIALPEDIYGKPLAAEVSSEKAK